MILGIFLFNFVLLTLCTSFNNIGVTFKTENSCQILHNSADEISDETNDLVHIRIKGVSNSTTILLTGHYEFKGDGESHPQSDIISASFYDVAGGVRLNITTNATIIADQEHWMVISFWDEGSIYNSDYDVVWSMFTDNEVDLLKSNPDGSIDFWNNDTLLWQPIGGGTPSLGNASANTINAVIPSACGWGPQSGINWVVLSYYRPDIEDFYVDCCPNELCPYKESDGSSIDSFFLPIILVSMTAVIIAIITTLNRKKKGQFSI